jgi:DNA helicase-2/ATP-dependent DNA helicase PcrA
MKSQSLLEGLNEPQSAAVLHGEGPLLVFAGAGSGKTRTLTHRIANLIREHDVPPSRILAVTFTNRASAEMRERLTDLVGEGARRIWMGTFHAMCAQMLRISGGYIGIEPRFVIFDTDDQTRLMKDILKSADIDSERYPASRVLHKISDQKNNLRSPDDFQSIAASPYDRVVARLYKTYQERLRASNALDFDDLLGESVRLLQESREAREYWSERFLHVLIDEFQDVNAAQFRWAQLLAEKHRNICVVGDDDQSIYAWRGANVKIILDFEFSYPDATVIRLEQNYRSTQPILDAAHGVISKNLGRKPKKLWTEQSGGAEIKVHGLPNAQEEAAWVVRQVQLLQRERSREEGGGKYSEFAILCRVNAQSRPFEEAFLRSRVPLRLVGTQRFYDRKEIKDLIGYLKVIFNPRDDVGMARVINVPARGIGAVTIEKLQTLARQSDRSLLETIIDVSLPEALGRAAAAKLAPVRELFMQLQEDARDCTNIADLLAAVVDRIDYLEFLRRERTVESVDRIANVQELMRAAEDFDKRMENEALVDTPDDYIVEGFAPESEEVEAVSEPGHLFNQPVPGAPAPANVPQHLGLFLESSALEGGGDSGAEGEAVTLMTLHSAKGLEFPVVFLVGMEQGLLPHARALWGEGSSGDELEEERRLCYVGLTRAREEIFLTYAAQRTMHGRTESSVPSQFLEEIPGHLVKLGGLAALDSNSAYRAATTWESGSGSSSYGAGSGAGSGAGYGGRSTTREAADPPQFAIGDKLRHPTFGEGFVLATSPSGGMGEWVEVAFLASGAGKKKLVVAFAPLEKVE